MKKLMTSHFSEGALSLGRYIGAKTDLLKIRIETSQLMRLALTTTAPFHGVDTCEGSEKY